VASPTPIAVSASRADWSSRLHYYKEFVRLNPIPFAVFAVLFVVLLLWLFVRGGWKQRRKEAYGKEKSKSDGARYSQTVSAEPAVARNRHRVAKNSIFAGP
jgi:hypothetical protein